MTNRVLLSPPDIGQLEESYLIEALRSGWVAPAGPAVDAFEQEVAERVGVAHSVAVSSGTAALHLPPSVEGAAFGSGPRAVLVLWAKTLVDQSEVATAAYSLPAAWQRPTLTRYAWDYVPGAAGQPCPGASLTLTGTPAFFVPAPLGR